MTIRVGTASPASCSTKETLRVISDLATRAAAQHIDLLLLPEAFIGGYPRGTAFGCVIGDRTYDGREEYARYFDAAADLGDTVGDGAGAGRAWVQRSIGGDSTSDKDRDVRGDGTREELEAIARDSGVFLVSGVIEKAGGSLYCAVVYVCPKEGVIGKRRKVMPTGTERLVWAQGSPSTLRAVTTTIRGVRVNLAAAICWENYMPLVRQALYSQNVNLYLAPTADGRDAWMSAMRTIGIEGRCFVVTSNMAVQKTGATTAAAAAAGSTAGAGAAVGGGRGRRNSTITEDGHEIALPSGGSPRSKRRKSVIDENGNEIVLGCDEDTPLRATQAAGRGAEWWSRGGSAIVNPFGDIVAGPQWEDDQGIIFADIDMRDCVRGRLDIDTAGSYSRNDSFKFSVNGLDMDPLPY